MTVADVMFVTSERFQIFVGWVACEGNAMVCFIALEVGVELKDEK